MKKSIVVILFGLLLTGCSILNLEFATSQDNSDCLKKNPSNICHQNK